MKKEIHPQYGETKGHLRLWRDICNSLHRSKRLHLRLKFCSACHPFYTGKQRILDTGGRVAKFEERFGKSGAK
ncbi:MAG: 50S ribosomal protein L31 [Actinomycetota bacterium]